MRAFLLSVMQHWTDAGAGPYPLVALYAALLWAATRQFRRLRRARRHIRAAVPLALTVLRGSHEIGVALGAMAALGSALAQSVGAGLAQLPRSTVAMQSITRTRRDAELAVLDRRAFALPIIASLSTLCGLLGTINGLAFQPFCRAPPANIHSKGQWIALEISQNLNSLAFALLLTLLAVAIDGLLEGWRLRLRANVEHALALLDAEVDALRPQLSIFGARVLDDRQGYRGA